MALPKPIQMDDVGGPAEMNDEDIKGHLSDKPMLAAITRNEAMYPKQLVSKTWRTQMTLAFVSLGIIYGDIGTSPLYVITTMFAYEEPNETNIIGGLSLVFWAVTLVVSIKYVAIVMNVNFHGEGGNFALLCKLDKPGLKPAYRNFFYVVAMLGAAFLIGDGVITPSISVLSAIEGLELVWDNAPDYEAYIASIILLGLYLTERFGTHRLGSLFGGFTLIWFILIGTYGLISIVQTPYILKAISPSYGFAHLAYGGGWHGILLLGIVVLSVTGVEALYADLGHFGAKPIRISWLGIVYPTLILNYLGQGALLLRDPSKASNPFFYVVPQPMLYPTLFIATMATIIASQAVISGSFSLISQAIGKGIFPRMKVKHTSDKVKGQVYIGFVNYFLMTLSIMVTLVYQHSANLTNAYGLAVSFVMFLTSILFTAVLHLEYHMSPYLIALYATVFFTIDLAFLLANLSKFVSGGYLPITIGIVISSVMMIWKAGREATEDYVKTFNLPLKNVDSLMTAKDVHLVNTVAVFMTSNHKKTPMSFTTLFSRTHSVPSRSIFLTVIHLDVPFINEKDRFIFQQLPLNDSDRESGVFRVIVFYGFCEVIDIDAVLPRILKDTKVLTSVRNVENDAVDLSDTASGAPNNAIMVDDDALVRMSSTEYLNNANWDSADANTHIMNITPTVTFYLGLERVSSVKGSWIGHKIWVYIYNIILRNCASITTMFRISKENIVEVVVPMKF
jgi:KUP system potassium uptake protein